MSPDDLETRDEILRYSGTLKCEDYDQDTETQKKVICNRVVRPTHTIDR